MDPDFPSRDLLGRALRRLVDEQGLTADQMDSILRVLGAAWARPAHPVSEIHDAAWRSALVLATLRDEGFSLLMSVGVALECATSWMRDLPFDSSHAVIGFVRAANTLEGGSADAVDTGFLLSAVYAESFAALSPVLES